jgi:DNA helicase-2/ATP-dependent DNA helicase PcrA
MMKLEEILEGLDPEQQEAVTAIRGPVCVIAGAGTGKTRVITHRIAYAVAAGVTDQSKTLALTFTARAAGEMRSRLRGLGVPNAAARTFHAAALKQLMYFWPYSFGGAFPKLLTSKSGFISEAMGRSDTYLAPGATTLREISSEIEWAKAGEFAPDKYAESATAASRSLRIPNGKSDRENFAEIAKVYDAYETLKRQERVIDFEDVLLLTVGMLEEDRSVCERIRDQYRYFTVDEYQDVSPLQQRLLNLWLGNRNDICVVGDAAQTIYTFAGATSAFLLGFTGRFPDANVVRLTRGYRSTPEIIQMANRVLSQSATHGDQQLVSMNTHGANFELQLFTSSAGEAAHVGKRITELDLRDTSVAILARTNQQLDIFERELSSRKIESQLKNAERFFDRVDVRDAMKVIRSASVLPNDENWLRDLESVLRPFGEADYIRALMALARSMHADGAPSLRVYLRELEDRAEQNNPPALPGVVLSTLHAAKGLEWDHVFLVGVNNGTLPLTAKDGSEPTPSLLEEERRLFYVGLTRAKRQVHISTSGDPSPFLTALTTQ